jgi:hypothetical protein
VPNGVLGLPVNYILLDKWESIQPTPPAKQARVLLSALCDLVSWFVG